jgi:hypothetical protein
MSIEEQIEARKSEARSKGIFEKADNIALHFGVHDSLKHSATWTHTDKVLKSEYTFYESYIQEDGTLDEANFSVKIKLVNTGQLVFEGWGHKGERIKAYVPGSWEEHFAELAKMAEIAKAKKEQDKKEIERKNFGL